MGITEDNSVFWNEVCGSSLARDLNIKDSSIGELKKYDDFFFNFYSYLKDFLPVDQLKNSQVVEVGLGYGTVGQYLAQYSKSYLGLDIAQGPVDLLNHRLKQTGAPGMAKVGNALGLPLESNSVDFFVTIGCLHHTGNFSKGVDEVYRTLRPGGRALIMVYYQYSYRRWFRWPYTLIKALFGKKLSASAAEREAYDKNAAGTAAPETEYFSKTEMRKICQKFSKCELHLRNIDTGILGNRFRPVLLWTLGRVLGLDLYIELTK